MFIILIDDIDNDIKSKISKFADDTKLGKVVKNQLQANEHQTDLKILHNCSKTWLMEFNLEKCVYMHFGNKNKNCLCNISDVKLKTEAKEKEFLF